MINLYVPINEKLKKHYSYPSLDLPEGLIRYSIEGKNYNINIVSSFSEDKIDAIFSMWGAAIEGNDEEYNRKINGLIIDKKVKLFTFWDDIHWWDNVGLQSRLQWFNLADLIFFPYYKRFIQYREYSQFVEKARWLPWWAPECCFSNDIPYHIREPKIALTGNCTSIYPLRKKIWENRAHKMIEYLEHPGYEGEKPHEYHGKKFYDYLVQYKGAIGGNAITTTRNGITHELDYTLKKNFEILGCGCLGFLEKSEELDDLGFRENQHYISINSENWREKFHNFSAAMALKVSNAGRTFVAENHSTKNRCLKIFEQIKNWHEQSEIEKIKKPDLSSVEPEYKVEETVPFTTTTGVK